MFCSKRIDDTINDFINLFSGNRFAEVRNDWNIIAVLKKFLDFLRSDKGFRKIAFEPFDTQFTNFTNEWEVSFWGLDFDWASHGSVFVKWEFLWWEFVGWEFVWWEFMGELWFGGVQVFPNLDFLRRDECK